jgi:hypothetical protein
MKREPDAPGQLDQHWMVTARRGGLPIPVTVLAKWRWYRRFSRRARLWYGTAEAVAIVASAAIPVAAAADLATPVIASLGAVALVATAARATFGLHENWIEYSQVGYGIEREAALYVSSAPPYDAADAAQQLVVRVETLAERGSQQWVSRRMSLEHAQQSNAGPHEAAGPATPSASG